MSGGSRRSEVMSLPKGRSRSGLVLGHMLRHRALPDLAVREEDRAFEASVAEFVTWEAHLRQSFDHVNSLRQRMEEVHNLMLGVVDEALELVRDGEDAPAQGGGEEGEGTDFGGGGGAAGGQETQGAEQTAGVDALRSFAEAMLQTWSNFQQRVLPRYDQLFVLPLQAEIVHFEDVADSVIERAKLLSEKRHFEKKLQSARFTGSRTKKYQERFTDTSKAIREESKTICEELDKIDVFRRSLHSAKIPLLLNFVAEALGGITDTVKSCELRAVNPEPVFRFTMKYNNALGLPSMQHTQPTGEVLRERRDSSSHGALDPAQRWSRLHQKLAHPRRVSTRASLDEARSVHSRDAVPSALGLNVTAAAARAGSPMAGRKTPSAATGPEGTPRGGDLRPAGAPIVEEPHMDVRVRKHSEVVRPTDFGTWIALPNEEAANSSVVGPQVPSFVTPNVRHLPTVPDISFDMSQPESLATTISTVPPLAGNAAALPPAPSHSPAVVPPAATAAAVAEPQPTLTTTTAAATTTPSTVAASRTTAGVDNIPPPPTTKPPANAKFKHRRRAESGQVRESAGKPAALTPPNPLPLSPPTMATEEEEAQEKAATQRRDSWVAEYPDDATGASSQQQQPNPSAEATTTGRRPSRATSRDADGLPVLMRRSFGEVDGALESPSGARRTVRSLRAMRDDLRVAMHDMEAEEQGGAQDGAPSPNDGENNHNDTNEAGEAEEEEEAEAPNLEEEELVHVRAIYDFVGQSGEDLNFHSGDVIETPLRTVEEVGWLYGRNAASGKEGWFPTNFTTKTT